MIIPPHMSLQSGRVTDQVAFPIARRRHEHAPHMLVKSDRVTDHVGISDRRAPQGSRSPCPRRYWMGSGWHRPPMAQHAFCPPCIKPQWAGASAGVHRKALQPSSMKSSRTQCKDRCECWSNCDKGKSGCVLSCVGFDMLRT